MKELVLTCECMLGYFGVDDTRGGVFLSFSAEITWNSVAHPGLSLDKALTTGVAALQF